MTLRIGIDIGGTFTDIVAIAGDGTVTTHKTLSTPHDYGEGIITGLTALLARVPGPVSAVLHACHAATGRRILPDGPGRAIPPAREIAPRLWENISYSHRTRTVTPPPRPHVRFAPVVPDNASELDFISGRR